MSYRKFCVGQWVVRFCVTPQVPKMIEKMKKIMISSDLLGLPWQHGIYEFKTSFFLTIMSCLYCVLKNSKIIHTFMFSEIVRPKMGLIDSSPLV